MDPQAHLPSDHLITASEASHLAERPTTPVNDEKDTAIVESTNASAWDDFPNGRFGDSTSPAYGALDSWATSGLGVTVSIVSLSLLSFQTSTSFLSSLFLTGYSSYRAMGNSNIQR